MRAFVIQRPRHASIETVPDPVVKDGDILLKVRMVGFCGSDLNSFRGLNPLVSFPRIPGHEASATVLEGRGDLSAGTDVALYPYTKCGRCSSCRLGLTNSCQFNQTLGVQRDGALAAFVAMPPEKLYPAKLTVKELCLVEPYIGYAKELVSYETRLFVQKELDVRGARNAMPEDFRTVIRFLETGKFPIDQAVSSIVSLDVAPKAFRFWSENPSRFHKILVSLD